MKKTSFFAAVCRLGPALWAGAGLMQVAAQPVGIGPNPRMVLADARPAPTLSRRPPWTISRITGSPEPPPPYLLERAFPKLHFSEPVALVSAPANDRLFLVQLRGQIVSFRPVPGIAETNLFIDLKELHPELTAAYGLVFHPKFQENGYVYICCVLRDETPDGSRVSRFTLAQSSPPRLDPKSEVVILTWLAGGHNGGDLHFGNDGYLYISTGDGKGPYPPDPLDTGQDLSDLLSSILRIDVDHAAAGQPYRVPRDNPFVNRAGARPEIWCYGLRNPWRMSIDRETGDLWIGDVGWETWEMIYRAQRGANYGWSYLEGKLIVKPDGKIGPTPIVPPTVMHHHSEAACIIGGYVYWGHRLPELRGAYIYGDYMTGRVWALRHQDGAVTWQQELADSAGPLVAFGQDSQQELYLVNYNGTLHQLTPNPAASSPPGFPRKLSETGLFENTACHRLAPGVAPFAVNAAQWNDGAEAERFLALPDDTSISQTNGSWLFPSNAVLGKTFWLPGQPGWASSRHRLETQILHFNGAVWNAYTYRWTEDQTDAELVEKAGSERSLMLADPGAPGGARRQSWRFHSRSECLRCHNLAASSVLGFTPLQLDRGAFNTLAAQGLFEPEFHGSALTKLVNPHDPASGLAERARSYLHANCSPCHREHAEGLVHIRLGYEQPLEKTGLLNAKPTQGDFAMAGARLVLPGDPYRSILYYRMAKTGRGRMPFIGSEVVDVEGVKLIHDWISQLPRPAVSATKATTRGEDRGDLAMAALEQLTASNHLAAAECASAIDQLLDSISGALALLRSLEMGWLKPSRRDAVLAKAGSHPNALVRDLFQRFIPEAKRLHTLGTNIKPEAVLSLSGNAARGRNLFFHAAGPQCFTCHRVGGEGREFGPDLSHIGGKYNRRQILENILEPSKTIEPKYFGFTVETKNGDAYTGLVVRRNENELVLKESTGRQIAFPLSEVATNIQLQLSLMPEQLLQNLTAQQAADLLEFLQASR